MAGLVPSGNIRELPPEELENMPVQGNEPGEDENTTTIMVDQKTGHVMTLDGDGGMTIDTNPNAGSKTNKETDFGDNLAEHMSQNDLDALGNAIWEGVENDLKTRGDFEVIFSKAIDLLGIRMEEASSQASNEGTVSKVSHPLLLETTVRYQANFIAEMLPATGPCKVKDDHSPDPENTPNPNDPVEQIIAAQDKKRDEVGEALEKDMNHYLMVTDKGYYPDTDRMAFVQGFCGNGFKKQYHHPLKRRPVSESIAPIDLIVSNNASDLYNALRVTHRTKMAASTMKRMQLNKSYRNVEIATPQPTVTETEQKIASIEGIDKTPQLPSDYEFTVYETLIDIDLKGFEHEEDGEPTGLPLPYIVTMERDSKVVLSIKRNWKEQDVECQKLVRIVHFPLIPGLGFLAYGFYHLLGNTTRALTGITRLLLDAGQFATFPGFLLAKGGSKQTTTEIRVSPGSGKEIDTGGKPIREVVMELPYKEPSPTLEAMREKLAEDGLRLGGAGQIPVGEGKIDVPVGTMLAAIEQTTKVMGAIHKRNHQAQQQELINLKELFAEDPTALWRFAKSPARKWEVAEEFADKELVPASDPNVPSQIHRIMLAQALIQLAASPAGMQIYNQIAVHERALRVLGIADPASLFKPPQPPQADPQAAIQQAELALKKQTNDLKAQSQATDQTQQQREAQEAILENRQHEDELHANLQDKQQQRDHETKIEAMKIVQEKIKAGGKAQTDIQKEHVKGIVGMKQEHVKGLHGLIGKKVDHEHAKEIQNLGHENAKDIQASAPKPEPKTPATKAKPKAKPKTTGAKK